MKDDLPHDFPALGGFPPGRPGRAKSQVVTPEGERPVAQRSFGISVMQSLPSRGFSRNSRILSALGYRPESHAAVIIFDMEGEERLGSAPGELDRFARLRDLRAVLKKRITGALLAVRGPLNAPSRRWEETSGRILLPGPWSRSSPNFMKACPPAVSSRSL